VHARKALGPVEESLHRNHSVHLHHVTVGVTVSPDVVNIIELKQPILLDDPHHQASVTVITHRKGI
jgi:hypothetical protein